ncbi:hypothetical protein GCM10023318_39620 [Nocardia callitridis]|uniref:Secreted protein n=1 Tax=Nocardia callitridis TaxID=648753 RepID=A0ABP9KHZ7_9NOCA
MSRPWGFGRSVVVVLGSVQPTFALGCVLEVFGTRRTGLPQHDEFDGCTQEPDRVRVVL